MDFTSFLITCVLIELTPGPNMTYLALLSSLEGRRAGFSFVAGVACGLSIIGVIALSGASVILQNDHVYEGLRWVGAAYLLWLAYETWRGAGGDPVVKEAGKSYFLRGLVTNILNPKAAMFYLAVFPTFLLKSEETMAHLLPMLIVYVAVATVIHGLIVIFAAKLQPVLTPPQNEKRARYIFTGALILVAIWFFLSAGR